MKDEYLSSLVGRSVQVYRGGPDSNVGVLLDVNDDYLTLQKEDGEIIYYKTAHIKSIKENSQIRFNSILKVYDSNNLIKAPTFNELVGHFKNQTISVNGKGPESKVGTLIDIKDDFLVLYTEQDGIIFYKEQHIKSFSHPIPTTSEEVVEEGKIVVQPTVKEEPLEEKTEELIVEATEEETKVNKMKEGYEQIVADNTNNLMTNLKYSWIKINRKGPESMEGLLVEANDDYLVLVVNNEIFRIATYHVKNFSLSINPAEQKDEQKDDQKQEQKQETKNAQTTNTSTDSEQSNESQKQESTDQETSTRSKLTYEEELNLANKRRNRRLKKKAQQRKK